MAGTCGRDANHDACQDGSGVAAQLPGLAGHSGSVQLESGPARAAAAENTVRHYPGRSGARDGVHVYPKPDTETHTGVFPS